MANYSGMNSELSLQGSSLRHFAKVVLACFGLAMLSLGALAEQPQPNEDQSTTELEDEIVVTGHRFGQKALGDSMVPIDIVSDEELRRQGATELDMLLRNVVPSFNISSISGDAAVVVRPINLRGLAPDHVLMLINGKRRHRGAVILWPRVGVSHGAQGPDLSAIPSIAIHQVEVLQDGASAQYGSDAIAGVMNFLFKNANRGGMLEFRSGAYSKGDGETTIVAGNVGLPWGNTGFLNLSMEFGDTTPTDRTMQRADAAALIAAGNTHVAEPAQRWGAAELKDDLKLWANFGRDLQNEMSFYGHANFAERDVNNRDFFFRNPNTRSGVFSSDGGATLLVGDALDAADGINDGSGGCPTVTITDHIPDPAALIAVQSNPNCFSFQDRFPGGFQPAFGGVRVDSSLLGGLRGIARGTNWDVSISTGTNAIDFRLVDSVNASLGIDTPTDFDPGSYVQKDLNVNLDLYRQLDSRFHLASGLEWRDEQFEIGLGDEASWRIGPYAAQGFSAGSNGFPGFSPTAVGTWNRANASGYAELEYAPTTSAMHMAAALRLEDYEDFGSVVNTKLSGRVSLTETMALRGSISTGFRAPTPGQQNAFNISTQWAPELMELVNNGTIPSTSRVAGLRGGKQLDAEKSLNLSVGSTIERDSFGFTVDWFQVELDDRLGVTRLFELRDDEIELLLSEGVTSAGNLSNFRFFANAFNTRTRGLEVMMNWQPEALEDRMQVSFDFNLTRTKVVSARPDLIDDRRIREVEDALPDTRWNLSVAHSFTYVDGLARMSYFDGWYDARDAWSYDGFTLLDLELSVPIKNSSRVSVGARNILDNEPGLNPNPTAIGNVFSSRAPFDTNGRYVYVRLAHRWGST